MQSELVLWGLPKGETDVIHQVVLITSYKPETIEHVKALAAKDGYHSFKVQVIDGSVPDFGATVQI